MQTLHLREQARHLVGQESSGKTKALGQGSDYDLGYVAQSRLGLYKQRARVCLEKRSDYDLG